MISLFAMLWVSAIFFGIVGMMRGWTKEIVSTAGIMLATFVVFQSDALLRGLLLSRISRDQAFIVQMAIFAAIIYLAYRSRTLVEERVQARPSRLQNAVLGALIGALNGYLMWGAVWYFLDVNEYPLAPLVIAPQPGSVTDQLLNAIPLVLLGGGAGGGGELFIITLVFLFLIVLFII